MNSRKRLGVAAAAGVAGALAVALAVQPATAGEPEAEAVGLHIENGRLVESTGNDFVMRGANHAHAWYTGQLGSLADIKALGANTVRVVLSSGHQWERTTPDQVAQIVSECKANRLICVLEVHDTTGYGEQSAAVSLDAAADYWVSVLDQLRGEEDHIIVNIGNEPFGNTGYEAWSADTQAAIGKLRSAGFEHTIMVDAPNWGQDWSGTMRADAQEVYDSDPTGNTIFSIHMYGVYNTAAAVRDYLGSFVDAGLPILVGEFGHNHSDGDPDEDAIMATAEELDLGYLGWSWSGNSSDVGYLDMSVNFDPNQLTEWGDRFFNGPNGVAETSEEATIYN
ncbi:glycoside hydrolase family 5 protein [Streptomyces triticirhizae]|uniref:Glycoside hydrolase family 5 protein n=1 Tax=Streptomyces triticirhizae TaxID=2483353 RepID=A0A3M2LQJ6_9ACTN|nr:glycoside hydrolase family 5 protein [Streptomyces triticirhizae]RMI39657.1 glycoside hydrolase family 5 protein [Streptomyces triticirhizae]